MNTTIMDNYTFEDWLIGKIGHTGNESDIANLRLQHAVAGNGINETEYLKIREAQKNAFNWAVEIMTGSHKDRAKEATQKAPDPKEWLDLEIRNIKQFITKNRETHQRYEENKTDAKFITGEVYQALKISYDKFKEGKNITGTWILKRDENGKLKPSRLQRMYIYKHYLKYLNELKREIGIIPKDIKEKAIQLTINSIDKKRLANIVLHEYADLKNKYPNRKINDLFNNEIKQEGFSNKTFYNWVNSYKENLKALGYAQEY